MRLVWMIIELIEDFIGLGWDLLSEALRLDPRLIGLLRVLNSSIL